MAGKKIIVYTAHHCPFAHRVQVVLRELGLSFETELVDILVPRTPAYLAINPSGQVPALSYDGKILVESGLICQFLADAHPSHLLPPSSVSGGASQRYQIGQLMDKYFSKAQPSFDAMIYALTPGARTAAAKKYIDAVVEHVEPLLANTAPFFQKSCRLTFAEVRRLSYAWVG